MTAAPLTVGDVLKIPTGQFRLRFGDDEDPMEYEYRAVLALVPNLKIVVTVNVLVEYTFGEHAPVFVYDGDLTSISALPMMAAEHYKVEDARCHGLGVEQGAR